MTRATKISGAISGTMGIIILSFALATADWSNRDDIVFSSVVSLVVAAPLFVALWLFFRSQDKLKVAQQTSVRKGKGWGVGVLVWLSLAAFYAVGGYAADWIFPESGWATKWRYSLESDLRDADYVIEKHPHDCEFMSAPLGDKHCHYDKQVATIRIRSGQSGREMSYDDGKSWSPATSDVRATVYVSWTRVND